MKSRIVAAVLAFVLGTLGVHKFYLGETKMGVIYLVVSLTMIGLIVTVCLSLYDTFKFLTMTDADFNAKYNSAATA